MKRFLIAAIALIIAVTAANAQGGLGNNGLAPNRKQDSPTSNKQQGNSSSSANNSEGSNLSNKEREITESGESLGGSGSQSGQFSTRTGVVSSGNGIQTYRVKNVEFTLVEVKGGTFTMGATSEQGDDAYEDEYPTHRVTLSTFNIATTEVTQELWQAVMGSNPSEHVGAKLPVENITWDQCQVFLKKLNALTGHTFRLPTEAEWEYAARGGLLSHGYKYSGSNDIDEVAWYSENSGGESHPVATKKPNELGIYDMSGNVREWCYDAYEEYTSEARTNPHGPTVGDFNGRGGAYEFTSRLCRVSNRGSNSSEQHFDVLGLRIVM